MSTRTQRRVRTRGVALGAIVAVLAFFGATAPVYAAPPTTPVEKYVALGDSYAAGQGAGTSVGGCLRSDAAYPVLLGAEAGIKQRTAACSGATIADVAAKQLSQVNKGTTLVTITVGANDLGVGAIYAACIVDDFGDPCRNAAANAETLLAGNALNNGIRDLVLAVAERAPNARIVVTDYPIPFGPSAAFGMAEYVNFWTARLDGKIAEGVAAAAAAEANVTLASAAFAFVGNQIGDPDSYLGEDLGIPESFLHPTAAGQAVYANLILAALGN